VIVALPSFSLGESLLSHYGDRIPALEHRYLLALLVLNRIACDVVLVVSQAPTPEVLDYYFSLIPEERRAAARRRLQVLEVPDPSHRPIAEKLLDRPDLVDRLRRLIGGRPAFIEPWNVTDHEVAVALALDAPINGSAPELWPLGFKSAGRRLFKEAGVPVAVGCEDVRTVHDVLAAVASVRAARPSAAGVVIKHDDSGAGDGNQVIDLRTPGDLRTRLEALPEWYLRDLASGGVVEELITGTRFTTPSVQIDVLPDHRVVVLATHEQVMGGTGGQVYMGCRFPADAVYAGELARHARAVGERLAAHGVIGRASIDFAAARDARGAWHLHALEVNLRKGGTTHPYAVLRNMAPGRYEEAAGRWICADGTTRAYRATDNLVDPAWKGVPPRRVIDQVAAAGLQLDPASGTGVVLHMLSCLSIDGRLGLTAIGRSAEHAAELYDAAGTAIAAAARPR
jgi:PGM1 C-terminal domain